MASKKKAKAPKFDTSFNFGANVKSRPKADRQAAAIFYGKRGRR